MGKSTESDLLKNWKLKLGLLMAIISPSVAATGAYYKLQINLSERNQVTESKVKDLELQVERNFASKQTMDKVQNDISGLKNDMTEIKVLLQRKLK